MAWLTRSFSPRFFRFSVGIYSGEVSALEYAVVRLLSTETVVDPADVQPGWIGGGVFAVLAVIGYFLVRSFIKQMRTVSEPWEGETIRVLPDPRIPVTGPGAVAESAATDAAESGPDSPPVAK